MADGREFVVVADDEAEARDVLQQILELEGFEVEGFANGAEALDYLNHSVQPCVIILGLLMPVMNGPQFRAAMLKDPRLAAIPIVVVTALEPTAAGWPFRRQNLSQAHRRSSPRRRSPKALLSVSEICPPKRCNDSLTTF
jgi:CheY-like chemotaxis protein